MTERVRNYFPISDVDATSSIERMFSELEFSGTEVFISSVVPREQSLFNSEKEKADLVKRLEDARVMRVHLSYWAEPCDFLDRRDFDSLLGRFDSKEEIKAYYSDLTGEHIYDRWSQEYEVAREVGAEAVTFHAIDYFHIDGLWGIERTKTEVLDSLANIINELLSRLAKKGLLQGGPKIEIENAGFGLETGVQTAEDYVYLFSRIKNKKNVGIGWDTNHLLHAVGYDPDNKKAYFLLDEKDKTRMMKDLEEKYGDAPERFFQEWIEHNLLNETTLPLVSSIHVSDLKPLVNPIFLNGPLTGKYFEEISELSDPVKQEDYGAGLVLKYYDSHLPIGESSVNFPQAINLVIKTVPQNLSLLHELKNSGLDFEAYKNQFKALGLLGG